MAYIILSNRIARPFDGAGLWSWWVQAHAEDAKSNDLTGLVIDSFHLHDLLLGNGEPVFDCPDHTANMVVGPRWVGSFKQSVSVLLKSGAAESTNT